MLADGGGAEDEDDDASADPSLLSNWIKLARSYDHDGTGFLCVLTPTCKTINPPPHPPLEHSKQ